MANEQIKKEALINGLYMWQVAELIGVAESTLCRWLRRELPEEVKTQLITFIRTQDLSQRNSVRQSLFKAYNARIERNIYDYKRKRYEYDVLRSEKWKFEDEKEFEKLYLET